MENKKVWTREVTPYRRFTPLHNEWKWKGVNQPDICNDHYIQAGLLPLFMFSWDFYLMTSWCLAAAGPMSRVPHIVYCITITIHFIYPSAKLKLFDLICYLKHNQKCFWHIVSWWFSILQVVQRIIWSRLHIRITNIPQTIRKLNFVART